MDKKLLQIEFIGENHNRLSNIAWMLLLINQIDNGYDTIYIKYYLSKNGYTETALNDAIAFRNYDRNIIHQYGAENGINQNWLLEYKEIVPMDYFHLLNSGR